MATTIDRSGITWTNDTGTPASPVGDGTLLNAAWLSSLLDEIDQLFNGTTADPFVLGAKLQVEGFGSHTFSAGGTGANIVAVRNTTAGTGNYAEVRVGNDTSASALVIDVLSSTYTGSNNVAQILNTLGSALKIGGTNASGTVEFLTNATTRLTISAAGLFTYGSGASVSILPLENGSASAPSLSFRSDPGTGFYYVGSSVVGYSYNGALSISFGQRSITIQNVAAGTGAVSGGTVVVGRNTDGNGAAGSVGVTRRGGTIDYLWTDDSGTFMTGTSRPTENNTTVSHTGTVVGGQTSTRATKHQIRAFVDASGALELIRRTPLYHFRYRGSDAETEHVGIMAEESPEFTRYGGTTFDPINAFGYTAGAVKALLARVETLEAALAAR